MLGRTLDAAMDPDSPEFDINALIKPLNDLTKSLTSTVSPLAAVAGPIPVVGELAPVLPQLAKQGEPTPGISKDDVKKMVPSMPEIPPAMVRQT